MLFISALGWWKAHTGEGDAMQRQDTHAHHDEAHEHNQGHEHSHDGAHEHGHDHDDHGHEHKHGEAYEHDQGHEHGHEHGHGGGLLGLLSSIFHFHGHGDQQQQLAADAAMATEDGIRTIWQALGILGATTVLQVVIVVLSGSVALLADTVHNLGDALNSIPLLIAFYLARRGATRRYTYGFGKAEDVAGIFIVLSIAFSAGYIFWESFQKLLSPAPLTNLPWVAAAAVIGFLGNEGVAWLQIRAGRRIGSDAMIADGMHARTDGLTSLAVLLAVLGTWLGFPIVDPLIGLLIGVAILFITRDAAKTIWYRLMDAVDPAIVDKVEREAAKVQGVQQAHEVRVRWLGHRLHSELHIVVDEDLPTHASHAIAEEVRHALLHALPGLSLVSVHVDPCGHSGADHHAANAHHAQQAQAGLKAQPAGQRP
jgi:cation diffusion facilitator family transporter